VHAAVWAVISLSPSRRHTPLFRLTRTLGRITNLAASSPYKMKLQLCAKNGLVLGAFGIALVIIAQAISSFSCYRHDFGTFLEVLGFIAIPMLPGIIAMFTASPYRALGAAIFFLPWLGYAYYVDCGSPYRGGGASMIYVAVVLWGFPCALVGALLTPRFSCIGASVSKNAA